MESKIKGKVVKRYFFTPELLSYLPGRVTRKECLRSGFSPSQLTYCCHVAWTAKLRYALCKVSVPFRWSIIYLTLKVTG